MTYATSIVVIHGVSDVAHCAAVIEAASRDEAIGKAFRVALMLYPAPTYRQHHVVVQSTEIVISEPEHAGFIPAANAGA